MKRKTAAERIAARERMFAEQERKDMARLVRMVVRGLTQPAKQREYQQTYYRRKRAAQFAAKENTA